MLVEHAVAVQGGITTSPAIRVLVAEEEEPLRAAICDLIASADGLEVVAVAATADEAIFRAGEVEPDVALLDARIAGGGGPRAARGIAAASPGTRSIALSSHHDRSTVAGMFAAGAVGYVVKGEPPGELLEAVRRAVRGQSSLSASLASALIGGAPDLEPNTSERREVLAHVVAGSEEERRRIASEIHDDSIQVMTAAGMRLQILRRSLTDPGQLARMSDVEQTIHFSIARLRHLISELRPSALESEGLSPAVLAYIEGSADSSGTAYVLDDRLLTQPSAVTRVILYRITQEALTNVRKHASAAHVGLTLESRDGGYYVRVQDDGVGFVPESTAMLGLRAIRQRAELAGGWLRVTSAPGEGASVEFWIGDEA